MKEYLLTAGPTPVPERVLLAMAAPMLYHRAPDFTECLRETQADDVAAAQASFAQTRRPSS